MTRVPHAIERALERYGLKLSLRELDCIAEECGKGYGRLSYMNDRKEKHLVRYRGLSLVVVYVPETDIYHTKGRVVTILPPEAATTNDIYSKSRQQRQAKAKPEISLTKFPNKITPKLRRNEEWRRKFERQRRELGIKHDKKR